MKRAAALLTLLVLSLSVQASVLPGAERPVSPPSASGSYGYQRILSVVTDGEDFLTLWLDETAGRDGIYATIVNDIGGLRPSVPEPLVRGAANAEAFWTGSEYVVLVTQGGSTSAIRLNRDAQPVSGFVATGLPAGSSITDVAWNGTRALAVVGQEQKTSLAFLDASGRVTESLIDVPGRPWLTRVIAGGRTFVAVWMEEVEGPSAGVNPLTRVLMSRVVSSTALSPVELMPPTRKYAHIDVASSRSGDDIGVAVTLSDATEITDQLHRYTIDADDLSFVTDPLIDLHFLNGLVEVVWTSEGFVAAYASYGPAASNGAGSGKFLTRARFGSTLQRDIPVIEVPDYELSVVSNSQAVLAVYGFFPIRAAMFDAGLTERNRDVRPLSIAPTRQTAPSATPGGNVILVTWVEPNAFSEGRLMVRRFDGEGNPLDAQPVHVGFTTIHYRPAVVFTGEVWLLAWQASSAVDAHVRTLRISPQGGVLDVIPLDLGVGSEPAMAFNGTVAALVLKNERFAGHSLIRFSPDGTKLDAVRVPIAGGRTYDPAIATNGSEFLVAWSADRREVFGRRLDAQGNPMDGASFAIANGPGDQVTPAIASRGDDFVVVYTDFVPNPMVDPPFDPAPPEPVYRVRAKRVLKTGVLADTTSTQEGVFVGEGTIPRIVAAGEGYVVTFVAQDYRGEREPLAVSLRAVATSERGAPLSSARLVTRYESDSSATALVAIGDAVWTLYPRLDDDSGGQQRVFLRELVLERTPTRRRNVRR
jgi:hypothetical protein